MSVSEIKSEISPVQLILYFAAPQSGALLLKCLDLKVQQPLKRTLIVVDWLDLGFNIDSGKGLAEELRYPSCDTNRPDSDLPVAGNPLVVEGRFSGDLLATLIADLSMTLIISTGLGDSPLIVPTANSTTSGLLKNTSLSWLVRDPSSFQWFLTALRLETLELARRWLRLTFCNFSSWPS